MDLRPTRDVDAIAALRAEYPDAAPAAVMMSCNPPLLILRALHKFPLHPQIPALKGLDMTATAAGRAVARLMKS